MFKKQLKANVKSLVLSLFFPYMRERKKTKVDN